MAENTMPYSPASGIHLRDSFLAHTAITDGLVGELAWNLATITGASTMAYLASTTAVAPGGGMRFTTDGTTGHGEAMHLLADSVVLAGQGGFFRAKIRFPDISGNTLTGNNFRVGLDDSVTATAPTVGLYVLSDAGVLSLVCDSADHGDFTAAVTGVSTLTSGTTMVLGQWVELYVVWSGTNVPQGGPKEAYLYVDGELGASITTIAIDNDEEMEPKFAHWDDGAGATLECDIAYYELMLNR